MLFTHADTISGVHWFRYGGGGITGVNCNPMAWTVYGVVASQLGDLNAQVAVPRLGFMTAKEYLK
ncbi:hypothetical protein ACS0TY_010117 [Phlomoides rotata]